MALTPVHAEKYLSSFVKSIKGLYKGVWPLKLSFSADILLTA